MLSDENIKESMMKLCNPKTGIMTKENAKKPKFEPNEKLKLKLDYVSPNIRFNFIPSKSALEQIKSGEGLKRIEQVEDNIKQERAMVLDANVVRIMKARKVLSHGDLLKDVMTQITLFKSQPIDIKKRIESLIERDYLKRDDDDKTKYIYLP